MTAKGDKTSHQFLISILLLPFAFLGALVVKILHTSARCGTVRVEQGVLSRLPSHNCARVCKGAAIMVGRRSQSLGINNA
jgi:hypothetical protein